MERVTRGRVLEPLGGERITRGEVVTVTLVPAVGPEEWRLVFSRGKNYGGAQAGRILLSLGGVEDPLAGLAYAVEHGRPYVHHIWVDPEARGRGLSQVLFDAYRSEVSPELIVVGPFTRAGRAAAERRDLRKESPGRSNEAPQARVSQVDLTRPPSESLHTVPKPAVRSGAQP